MLNTQSVARLLDVGAARVRQMDAVLRPARMENGQRVYNRERVEAYAAVRASRKR